MAHLWIHAEGLWNDISITENSSDISPAVLMRSGPEGNAAGQEMWVLIAPPDAHVQVNGETSPGIRALTDRDEIRIGGRIVYFSAERLASVLPFAGNPVPCARCKLQIRAGEPSVSCPACSVWHHQSAEYPCWTYAPHCSLCPCGTDLNSGYQWSPEEV